MVIDEFDSGVFEFLLGELLRVFQIYGKGQLIFTSHNLRPLEVIDKKFIRFTTSNEYDRFYKMKNVAKTNNLRDLFLTTIRKNNIDAELYNGSQGEEIASALIAAGHRLVPEMSHEQ